MNFIGVFVLMKSKLGLPTATVFCNKKQFEKIVINTNSNLSKHPS